MYPRGFSVGRIPLYGAGSLLSDQKGTQESPGWTQSDCGGMRRLVLHAVHPGPRRRGRRRWGFRWPLRPRVVARRFGRSSSFPTAAPAAQPANVTRQALGQKRFSRFPTTAARTLSVQNRLGARAVNAKISARRTESGSGARRKYRTPCLRRSIEHCTPVEQKEVRNHGFRGSLGTFHPWKVRRRRHNKP